MRGPRAERALADVGFSAGPAGARERPRERHPEHGPPAEHGAGALRPRAGLRGLHVPMVSDAAPRPPRGRRRSVARNPGSPQDSDVGPRRGLLYLLVVALAIGVGWAVWPRAPRLSPGAGARAGDPTVVFLGDSITHGHRLSSSLAFPHRLGQALGCPRHQCRHLGGHDGRRAPAARAGRARPPTPRGRGGARRERRLRPAAPGERRPEPPGDHAGDSRPGRAGRAAPHRRARRGGRRVPRATSGRSPGPKTRRSWRTSSRAWCPPTPTTGSIRTSKARRCWPSACDRSSARRSTAARDAGPDLPASDTGTG